MAAYGFSAIAVGNNLPSGISSVVTDLGTSNSVTLSDLKDTKFSQVHLFDKNQSGMERVHAIEATASWKFNIADPFIIPLLAQFAGAFHTTALNLINGDVVVFGNSTVAHNGVPKWKLVIEGDMAQNRYIEMMLKRKAVVASATASIYDNDILWSTFTSGDYTNLFTGAAAYRSPSGVKTFGIRNTGETNYETVGPIQNTSFTAELNCDEDSEGRYIPRGTISISYSIEVLAATPTSLAVLDTLHQVASNDCKFTLMDNVIITCVDNLGCVCDVLFEGDVNTPAKLKFHGSGEILASDWSGIIS